MSIFDDFDPTLDMTDSTPEGFVEIQPGRYPVKFTGEAGSYQKGDTGNVVTWYEVEITGGDYEGEPMRYFHTFIRDNMQTSVRFFRRFLEVIGLISEDDRDNQDKLKATLKMSETPDERDNHEIEGVVVNGTLRSFKGCTALAVVTPYADGTSIDRMEPTGAAGTSEASSDKDKSVPF